MVATVPWEILEANMLPPTTASDVQIKCPSVAPAATPAAFLWVASCIEVEILEVNQIEHYITVGQQKPL